MSVDQATIEHEIADILREEGGLVNNPSDHGSITKYGITIPTMTEYLGRPASPQEIEDLTPQMAHDVYLKLFVMSPGFVQLNDPDLFGLTLDIAVNHGRVKAAIWLQELAKVVEDGHFGPVSASAVNALDPKHTYHLLLGRRVRFYGSILQHDHSQVVFAGGWLNRSAEFIENSP